MMKKTKALRQGGSNPDAQGVQRGFTVALYQNRSADESVQLRRNKKRINRIAENDQIGTFKRPFAFCEVFLICFYTLPDVQVAELSVGKSIRNK